MEYFNKNILAVAIGATMIIANATLSYFYQKNLFGKFRNKVKHAMDFPPEN